MKNADLDVLGGNFREITDAQKKQLNISYGLEVIKVSNGKMKDAESTKDSSSRRLMTQPLNRLTKCNRSSKMLQQVKTLYYTFRYLPDRQEGLLRRTFGTIE